MPSALCATPTLLQPGRPGPAPGDTRIRRTITFPGPDGTEQRHTVYISDREQLNFLRGAETWTERTLPAPGEGCCRGCCGTGAGFCAIALPDSALLHTNTVGAATICRKQHVQCRWSCCQQPAALLSLSHHFQHHAHRSAGGTTLSLVHQGGQRRGTASPCQHFPDLSKPILDSWHQAHPVESMPSNVQVLAAACKKCTHAVCQSDQVFKVCTPFAVGNLFTPCLLQGLSAGGLSGVPPSGPCCTPAESTCMTWWARPPRQRMCHSSMTTTPSWK
jgi:hypothetical protein